MIRRSLVLTLSWRKHDCIQPETLSSSLWPTAQPPTVQLNLERPRLVTQSSISGTVEEERVAAMNVTLSLNPEVEKGLMARAHARGQG